MKASWLVTIAVLCLQFLGVASAATHIPRKFKDARLTRPAPRETHFSAKDIATRNYVLAKSAEWRACKQRVKKKPGHPGLYEGVPSASPNESLEAFLQSDMVLRRLVDIEARLLLQGGVSVQPWSGDYWPYSNGLIAARFLDPAFAELFTWKARYQYVQDNSAVKILEQFGQEGVNRLSPAEKYDLLIGSGQGTFSEALWRSGERYADEEGNVEGWMGLCHGWAPAAIFEPRPVRAVVLKSPTQKWSIPLNPSEIKGLATYSWATNRFSTITLGERCNKKIPETDENGRVIDPECFDLNPGTWHLAMVNMVGLQKRSFIMDATYDYEVWNQPIVSYSFGYVNPVNGLTSNRVSRAAVPRGQYTKDPYAKYRSPSAESIVNVTMRVGYVVETSASADLVDSTEKDSIRWVSYDYDLELNGKGEVIGGEWHTSIHPDFIWTPLKGSKPLSPMDQMLGPSAWNPEAPLPQNLVKSAKVGSGAGYILNRITEAVVKASAVGQ